MPTFRFDHPWPWYVAWNAVGFVGAFLVNSFIEHLAHRFVLHGTRFGRFAYDLHDQQHHVIFDGGEYYHAKDDFMRSHVTFVFRDYALFLLVTTPIWIGVELLVQRPFIAGGILATLAGLHMFNVFHWKMHCPSGGRFEKTWFFKAIDRHHRLHHADTRCNLNVAMTPLADFIFRTLKR